MGNLFSKFWWFSREHVSEDVLLSLLDGELWPMHTRKVQKHLQRCWTCRVRRDQLEKTIGRFVDYRQHLVKPYMPPPPRGREMFLAKLEERIQTRRQPWWIRSMQTLRQMSPQTMSPIIASMLVVGVAALLLFLIWQRNLPTVSAHQLLEKAQMWDISPSSATRSVVVYQKVEVRTRGGKLERAIYRDSSGKRKPLPVTLSSDDEAIQQKVQSAGVNLQEPLSAINFREWHDRQSAFSDKVTRSGDLLLTLTTSLPSGPIASESLTVRANDFHPVKRTIETRDNDRIEIAELNYAVLGWNEVNEALFEPLAAPRLEHPVLLAPLPTLPALPTLPTEAELDGAELEVRLALNRLHADEGERVNIIRTERNIEVKGIVDSTERKQEVVNGLKMLSHVKTEVLSAAEIQPTSPEILSAQPTSVRSIDPVASPLEEYVESQPQKKLLLNDAPQGLVDAAFRVRHSADELDTIAAKFTNSAEGTPESAAVRELTQSYTQRLVAALDSESSIMRQFGLDETANIPANISAQIDLAAEVQRNDALCLEMVTQDSTTRRTASEIAADIRDSIVRIRSVISARSETGTKEQMKENLPNPW